VLSTGKYLNVIQQCDKSAQWAALQSLEYLPNSEHYHPIIEKVFLYSIERNIKIYISLIEFKVSSLMDKPSHNNNILLVRTLLSESQFESLHFLCQGII
jgi:hypothetical protein